MPLPRGPGGWLRHPPQVWGPVPFHRGGKGWRPDYPLLTRTKGLLLGFGLVECRRPPPGIPWPSTLGTILTRGYLLRERPQGLPFYACWPPCGLRVSFPVSVSTEWSCLLPFSLARDPRPLSPYLGIRSAGIYLHRFLPSLHPWHTLESK